MAVGHTESLEAITQNLANSSTPGYRRLQISHKLFDTLLRDATSSVAHADGLAFDPLSVDFSQGPIRPTNRPLDFSIRGNGFFVVSKDGQDYYTRKGDFTIDANGNLHNADGLRVEGVGGPIQLPSNTILHELTVSDDGSLQTGTQTLGKLKLVTFKDTAQLLRAGSTLFKAPDGVQPEDATSGTTVANRMLEQSNTSVAEEMADLIKTMRNYEACRKMIQNDDDTTGKMIQQVSTP